MFNTLSDLMISVKKLTFPSPNYLANIVHLTKISQCVEKICLISSKETEKGRLGARARRVMDLQLYAREACVYRTLHKESICLT